MVSDHLNENVCWIELYIDALSEENKKIYQDLDPNNVIKFSYHQGCINFGVNSVGKDGQLKLLEIAKMFKMQDVPVHLAYLTPEEFLMQYCGCYEEYKNPNYRFMKSPWEQHLNIKELKEYLKEYSKWENSEESVETLKRFAPEKATKPIHEFSAQHGMIYDNDRVYLSAFHYNKHLNYIKYTFEEEQKSNVLK